MKRIWPWLLLLLLLIIFCIWSKKDSIHITEANVQKATTPMIEEVHYIEYSITQNKDNYTLNGNFKNIAQQELLADTVSNAQKTFQVQNTSTNKTLLGEPALTLTNKILPHFIKTYTNGKINYSNQKIKINGMVKSYEAQHEMQRLLNTSTLASQDNSTVVIPTKPIYYTISKVGDTIEAQGTFDNHKQVTIIKAKLPDSANTNFKVSSHHRDKGSLLVIEKFLPSFMTKYTQGNISYKDEVLTITGTVESDDDLAMANKLLTHSTVNIRNKTVVDNTKALEAARIAKEQARLAAVQAQQDAQRKKAALEAKEKARLAALQAEQEAEAKKAALAAKEKARLAALQAEQEAEAEAKRVALEAKERAKLAALQAQRETEAKKAEMKTKIANLLKLENIEFNVNKSTLTIKGQATVDKLAIILKEYTSINLEIAGHTDSDGSAEYNQKLSQARVDMVKSKLIANTITASRLTAKGYGETQPLVPNTSKANKQRNRRVEINILGE